MSCRSWKQCWLGALYDFGETGLLCCYCFSMRCEGWSGEMTTFTTSTALMSFSAVSRYLSSMLSSPQNNVSMHPLWQMSHISNKYWSKAYHSSFCITDAVLVLRQTLGQATHFLLNQCWEDTAGFYCVELQSKSSCHRWSRLHNSAIFSCWVHKLNLGMSKIGRNTLFMWEGKCFILIFPCFKMKIGKHCKNSLNTNNIAINMCS